MKSVGQSCSLVVMHRPGSSGTGCFVFHMAWRMTATLRATATRAFLKPDVLASFIPHAFSVEKQLRVSRMLVRIRVKIENELRELLRTFGVLFGKRVGSFTERAGEIIAGELDASPEMRLVAETLMKARPSILDQIKVLDRLSQAERSERIWQLLRLLMRTCLNQPVRTICARPAASFRPS